MPVESDQDVAEYQFGFLVDTIAGKTLEEIKAEATEDVTMQEEDKTEEQKKEEAKPEKEKKQGDENESKILEQTNNKKKSVLEDKTNIFTPSEGRLKVADTFIKYFEVLYDFFETAAVETIETKPSVFSSHRRSTSINAAGPRNLIATKYRNEAIERITIGKLLGWFNTLLSLQSSEFLKAVKESDILKHIVELCEIYDDHSLIQGEIRRIFATILNMEDIMIKKKLLNEGRGIFLFAKKLNMVDFSTFLSRKKSRGRVCSLELNHVLTRKL